MKKLTLFVLSFFLVFSLVACGGSSTPVEKTCEEDPTQEKCEVVEKTCEEDPTQEKCEVEEIWGPATDVEGTIDIMLWSGDDSYLEDIGHKDYEPEELFGQNQAAAYAVAKEFNKIYPNVKINIYAKSGGPGSVSAWNQSLENFKTDHQKFPDLWASMDVVGEISRGMIADLSQFSDDPLYQTFNPKIMEMMNFYGFQAGLPQYLLPWGVYVNYDLAEANSIFAPPVDWDLDEYTDFITQADRTTFFGAMDATSMLINTASNDIVKSLASYTGEGAWVNLNSDEVKTLLDYIPQWADYSVWPERDKVEYDEVTEEEIPGSTRIPGPDFEAFYGNGWGFTAFRLNRLLTLAGDPWMMGDLAHPDPNHWGAATMDNWDIYPRPASEYVGNTVGVVLDPMVVYNHCALDGNPQECTEEEQAQTLLTYKFASFWVGDTRSWQARAAQDFADGTLGDDGVPTTKTSLNDSFPFVVGEEFDKQMEAWYSVGIHQKFADADKMPGFHKVLELWQAGQIWDISDKSYPLWWNDEGESRQNLVEWNEFWNPEYAGGFARTDDGWLDQIKSQLPDWNITINERFDASVVALQEGLKQYYGYADTDFGGNFK